MTYNFANRLDYLGTRMHEINYERALVVRGNSVTEELHASPVMENAKELFPGVVQTQIQTQDWIITTADLNFEGTLFLPQRGDKLVRLTINLVELETPVEYTVVSPDDEKEGNPFRYTTPSQKRVRVHSVLTGPYE